MHKGDVDAAHRPAFTRDAALGPRPGYAFPFSLFLAKARNKKGLEAVCHPVLHARSRPSDPQAGKDKNQIEKRDEETHAPKCRQGPKKIILRQHSVSLELREVDVHGADTAPATEPNRHKSGPALRNDPNDAHGNRAEQHQSEKPNICTQNLFLRLANANLSPMPSRASQTLKTLFSPRRNLRECLEEFQSCIPTFFRRMCFTCRHLVINKKYSTTYCGIFRLVPSGAIQQQSDFPDPDQKRKNQTVPDRHLACSSEVGRLFQSAGKKGAHFLNHRKKSAEVKLAVPAHASRGADPAPRRILLGNGA